MTVKLVDAKTFDASKPLLKIVEVATKATAPTDSQIAAIRQYCRRDFSADDLYVRQMMLANDQYDRSYERFDAGYLRRFAETAAGKSVLVGHDYGSAPIGRFFDAEITRDAQGWQWVAPFWYMPVSQGNQLERDNIDAGVWNYVSIGFQPDYAGLICDLCGQPYYPYYADESAAYCRHIKGDTYDGQTCTCTYDSTKSDMSTVEMVEGSIVYLGCQYEAAIAKSAEQGEQSKIWKIGLIEADNKPPRGEQKQEDDMTIEELQAKNTELSGELATVKDNLTAANAKIAELTTKAEIGTKLLTDLKDEIKRLATCIGRSAAEAEIVVTTDDVTKLLEIKTDYEKQWSAKQAESGKGEGEGANTGEDTEAKRLNPQQYSVI